jgi:hypothetical protein
MVYVQAARKTAGFMVLAVVLSLAVVIFLSGSIDGTTGRVTGPGVTSHVEGSSWIVFILGVFVGALVVGAYLYIARLEAKRNE